MGMRIIINDNIPSRQPVLQLSKHIDLSPEFRDSMDKWLLDTFGYNINFYVLPNQNTIVVNSEMYDELIRRTEADSFQLPT